MPIVLRRNRRNPPKCSVNPRARRNRRARRNVRPILCRKWAKLAAIRARVLAPAPNPRGSCLAPSKPVLPRRVSIARSIATKRLPRVKPRALVKPTVRGRLLAMVVLRPPRVLRALAKKARRNGRGSRVSALPLLCRRLATIRRTPAHSAVASNNARPPWVVAPVLAKTKVLVAPVTTKVLGTTRVLARVAKISTVAVKALVLVLANRCPRKNAVVNVAAAPRPRWVAVMVASRCAVVPAAKR